MTNDFETTLNIHQKCFCRCKPPSMLYSSSTSLRSVLTKKHSVFHAERFRFMPAKPVFCILRSGCFLTLRNFLLLGFCPHTLVGISVCFIICFFGGHRYHGWFHTAYFLAVIVVMPRRRPSPKRCITVLSALCSPASLTYPSPVPLDLISCNPMFSICLLSGHREV